MSRQPYMPIALVVVGLALLPLGLTSNTVLNFLAFAMIITLAAQGWNILALSLSTPEG